MKKISELIYKKSPYWIQNILISKYGQKLINERYGVEYFEELKRLKSKNSSNLKLELLEQNNNIISLLQHAITNSPYYRIKYQDIDIHKIRTVEDLKLLPIISKEEVREKVEEFYTLSEVDAVVSYTGGTTGKSLKVLFTKGDMQKRMAYLDFFKFQAGIENIFSVRKASFGGRELIPANSKRFFWRFNKAYNQRLYSTYHINDTNLPEYIENLQKFKPEVINGFVSAIYDIATFIELNEINLKFKPIAIFTTSETLLSFHREKIERVFKTKVFDQYASSEGAPFITECIKGNLHYNIDTGVIEQGELDENGAGNMIITSFTTYGTPLIRYDIQDKVIFSDATCSCGSSHPIVKSIEGRQVDYLRAVDGTNVTSSSLSAVIKGVQNSIKKIQFIQRELKTIEVLIVVDKVTYSEKDNKILIKAIKYRFGEGMDIDLKFVEDIPREKSGKYSFIKNLL